MKVIVRIATLLAAASCIVSCGGDAPSDLHSTSPRLFAVSNSGSTLTFTGPRNNYTITSTNSGFSVKDNVGSDGTVSATSSNTLKFTDVSVNLGIGAKASTISTDALQSLIELYIAYFNRAPDADGLSYWIDQYKAGQSLDQIGTSFYSAAVQFSSVTGYSSSMTNEDFVRLIYKNVLGRDNADADGVNYWTTRLGNGQETRGSLVRTMLGSAHTFKGDATYGWVADLLDNKLLVGKWFAVNQGLNYLTPEDSIAKGMAIAAAVTSTGTADALSVVNVSDASFTTASSTSYTAPAFAVGDYFSYKVEEIGPFSGVATQYVTDIYTSIATDGSYASTTLYPTESKATTNFSAAGAIESSTYLDGQGGCTYSPAYLLVPKTLSPGLLLSGSTTGQCHYSTTYSSQDQLTFELTVTGTESVTVAAGTFNAVKYTYKILDSQTDNFSTTLNERKGTCWRDLVSGAVVKCVYSLGSPGALIVSLKNSELIAYSRTGSSKKAKQTFAGTWNGSYIGGDTGNCTVSIALDGAVTGSCSGGLAGVLTITGNVDDQGRITFHLTDSTGSSPTFTGAFTSPLILNGTWSMPDMSGTWSLAHE